MDVRSAMILAVVQGLTEFLPVSSSGHLVIVRELLHVEEALLSFDVLMHLGTLISVFLVFREDVRALINATVGIVVDIFHGVCIRSAISKDDYRKMAIFIVIASVPAGNYGNGVQTLGVHAVLFQTGCGDLSCGYRNRALARRILIQEPHQTR